MITENVAIGPTSNVETVASSASKNVVTQLIVVRHLILGGQRLIALIKQSRRDGLTIFLQKSGAHFVSKLTRLRKISIIVGAK